MQRITGVLAEAGINIAGSVTNDSAEYGIVRMIVSEPEQAVKVLGNAGYLCRKHSVLGVEITDEAGALNQLLSAVSESNINVNYIYLSFSRESARPVIIMNTNDSMEVEECLKSKGYQVL